MFPDRAALARTAGSDYRSVQPHYMLCVKAATPPRSGSKRGKRFVSEAGRTATNSVTSFHTTRRLGTLGQNFQCVYEWNQSSKGLVPSAEFVCLVFLLL